MSAASFPLDLLSPQTIDADDIVLLVGEDLVLPSGAATVLGQDVSALIAKAASVEGFKGKFKSAMTLTVPTDLKVGRLVVVGVGGEKERASFDALTLGGFIHSRLGDGRSAGLLAQVPSFEISETQLADLILGMQLRAYKFDRYKTKKKDGEEEKKDPAKVSILTDRAEALRATLDHVKGLVEGVNLARELVNEPPNVLFPEEFANRAAQLASLGVEIEVLDEDELTSIGMRALLGVAQGSVHKPRVVIMRWMGGAQNDVPLAFIGKGVSFDSGGISIKPGQGMEDMKGDMAGAACVVGLMHALASRKAKANVIGAIGLVENMPDGAAQRPGDIVTSLSGQTVEIINTDAEGRLVLGDVLWYVQERFKPRFMIDLATLTGAILIALAQEYAGMFSNNDELAERLTTVGKTTGEKVWRMPMGPDYDKMIDSKFADMKNTGGRNGGSITAAQFLQRFVNDVPWVHLDIAGTGMAAPQNDTNRSWGSGWGVRLLDRLVRDYYEA